MRYVVKSVPIDNFSELRVEAPLTRDRCKQCGFSVCERNNLKPYADMSPEDKQRVLGALEAHKKLAHPILGKASDTVDAPTLDIGGDTL